jgi:parvulin-like peptidyl-prolyl isomerase
MLMQKLRKNIKYVLIIVLVGFLLLIFFQWGGDILGVHNNPTTDVALIDGTKISYREYLGFMRAREAESKNVTPDQVWALLLEEMMWNKLIKKEKISVSDMEILAFIRNNPPQAIYESEYMRNEQGEFDYNKYIELLKAPQSRSWLLDYEYQLRRTVPREKLRALLSSFGWTSPYEDSMGLALQMTRYDIAYLQLPMFRARALLDVTDDEIAEYYAEHGDDFVGPEQRVLKFVFFERKPAPYDTIEARERIEDFLIRVEEGEDFLELAQEFSDDTLITITFKGSADLKPYLMNVYKTLRNNEVSGIIDAPHGFEVIKRISTGKIYKMKTEIEVSQTTIGEIYDRIMAFKETEREIGFDSCAADYDLQVRKTYPMALDNINFPVRNTDKFAEFVQHVKPGEIGGPFSSLGGYYLLALDSIIPETRPAFENIESKVRMAVEQEKLPGIMTEYLDRAYGSISTGQSLEDLAAKDTMLFFRHQENLNLAQIQMGLGGEFAGRVANMEQDQLSEPLVLDWAGYIIRCDGKTTVAFDSTMIMPLQMKKQSRLQEIMADLFTPEKIIDNRDDFFID